MPFAALLVGVVKILRVVFTGRKEAEETRSV